MSLASGQLWERYGYVNDDPAARFSLRLLSDAPSTLVVRFICCVIATPDVLGDQERDFSSGNHIVSPDVLSFGDKRDTEPL